MIPHGIALWRLFFPDHMSTIDTSTLAKRLAGGHAFLRTKNGDIKGLAINARDNPDAPEVLIVGLGPNKVANAERLLAHDKAVPLYLKQDVNAWSYRGEFRATAFLRDPPVIERHRRHRAVNEVAGILFLERVDANG